MQGSTHRDDARAEVAARATSGALLASLACQDVTPALCSCGSGRRFDRCHGDPANDFARAQALLEARQLATLFPTVRLRSFGVLDFARRAANELGSEEEVPEELLAEGIELVDSRERRALVDAWSAAYPQRWESLCHAAGDIAAAERETVRGALEMGIVECQRTPRELLAEVEHQRLRPTEALGLVLPPHGVWSLDEAHVAETAAQGREPAEAFRAVEAVATALGLEAHAARVRSLASIVASELPIDGFPRASRTLARACERVEHDVPFLRGVLALTLIAYVAQLPPLVATAP